MAARFPAKWNLHAVAIFAGLLAATPILTGSARAENRLAFIVGNDTYQNVDPLKKAVNDARAVAQKLESLGYRVSLGENFSRRDFNAAFSAFEAAIQPGDRVLFYYSGHGVELDGANYLIPVDVPKIAVSQQALLKDEAVSTDNIIVRLKERGVRTQIVVLDACRENPFRDRNGRALGGTRGLAATRAPGGVFVMYSAGVGEVALDRLSDADPDPNSIFTRSLLPLLGSANLTMVEVAKETRSRVKSLASTIGMTQSPAYYDEVDGDLFIATSATAGTSQREPPAPRPQNPAPQPAQPPPPMAARPPQPTPPVPARDDATGFIFPDSHVRRLQASDLRGLSRNELRIARNEIYARRGRFFRDPALAAHFQNFSWYRPHSWDVNLNAVEAANVKLLQAMER